jgi:hypothetical protein
MPFLHPAVSQRKFSSVVERLKNYADVHRPPWTVVTHVYPFIGIHVLNVKGEPRIALRLDASEWPHRPLSVRPMTLDFQNVVADQNIPKAEAVEGGCHIYADVKRGSTWFCTQGTMEFHENYSEDVPWESVREKMPPERIISRCLALIDRSKL